MNLVLINPNQNSSYPQPPVGLAILAAIAREMGFSVKIIDANALNLSEEDILKEIRIFDSDLVGISVMSPYIESAETIIEKIKRDNPTKKIILGGPHASVVKGKILEENENIDFVVFGEGEETIAELLDSLKNKKSLEKINGLAFRKDKKIIENEKRDYVRDLNKYPMPAYDLLPIKYYKPFPPHGKELPFMPLITSRGCPYNCLFCYKELFGRNYITKDTKNIIKEIKYLVNEMGIKEIMFYDDTFTYDRERIIDLCNQMIENDIIIPWSCETRVNHVDKELLEKMKQAGCYLISYGIESGNQDVLNVLRKGITLEQSEKAVKLTHDVGIMTVGYYMIGTPDETPENIKETIEFAKRLDTDFVQFSICTPIPGSDLYDMAIRRGMKPNEWKNSVYVAEKEENKPFLLTDKMTAKELLDWYSIAYKEYYLRPQYILKALKRIKSKGDIKININGLKLLINMIKG